LAIRAGSGRDAAFPTRITLYAGLLLAALTEDLPAAFFDCDLILTGGFAFEIALRPGFTALALLNFLAGMYTPSTAEKPTFPLPCLLRWPLIAERLRAKQRDSLTYRHNASKSIATLHDFP
jgi:hypothetical protein